MAYRCKSGGFARFGLPGGALSRPSWAFVGVGCAPCKMSGRVSGAPARNPRGLEWLRLLGRLIFCLLNGWEDALDLYQLEQCVDGSLGNG